jgi:hypothetical protein
MYPIKNVKPNIPTAQTPEHQIAKSAYTHDHIRYMESLNWVLRVQDDRFVYVKIERDGSYNTADIDED